MKNKRVSFVIEKIFQQNILFDRDQTKIYIIDNVFDKYYSLFDEFYKNSYDIATNDINTIEKSDIVIYKDIPKILPLDKDIHKSYVILMESPLVAPSNLDKSKHKYFNKIFTWDDTLVDNKKYYKINYAFKIPKKIPKNFKKPNLCCLIVGNKYSNHKNELYSERKKVIRWFEENHQNEFDLFGVGWNKYKFEGIKPIRALNKISILTNIMYKYFGESYPSYKGRVDNKFDTMQNYRFAICYENIQDISGYITEKILDVMFAGCVPIYLGAENITNHIPKECFIDKRCFNSYNLLYKYLSNMSEHKYLEYLSHIESFLNSEKGEEFNSDNFAKTIVSGIIKE